MRVVFRKVDLDTCLTGLIAGITDSDRLTVVSAAASVADLQDPEVLCIEAGGSGQWDLNNFDHHDPQHYFPPACRQMYTVTGRFDATMARLVDYTCCVDEALPLKAPIAYPSLSGLFSGMKLAILQPCEQFRAGMRLLDAVYQANLDPFDSMPEDARWKHYACAKKYSLARLDRDMQNALFFFVSKQTKVGFVSSREPGALGRLYRYQCQIGVAFNPETHKYTIGSPTIDLSTLLNRLDAVDKGWGGRNHIIGSPMSSLLTPKQVVRVLLSSLTDDDTPIGNRKPTSTTPQFQNS